MFGISGKCAKDIPCVRRIGFNPVSQKILVYVPGRSVNVLALSDIHSATACGENGVRILKNEGMAIDIETGSQEQAAALIKGTHEAISRNPVARMAKTLLISAAVIIALSFLISGTTEPAAGISPPVLPDPDNAAASEGALAPLEIPEQPF